MGELLLQTADLGRRLLERAARGAALVARRLEGELGGGRAVALVPRLLLRRVRAPLRLPQLPLQLPHLHLALYGAALRLAASDVRLRRGAPEALVPLKASYCARAAISVAADARSTLDAASADSRAADASTAYTPRLASRAISSAPPRSPRARRAAAARPSPRASASRGRPTRGAVRTRPACCMSTASASPEPVDGAFEPQPPDGFACRWAATAGRVKALGAGLGADGKAVMLEERERAPSSSLPPQNAAAAAAE